MRSQFREIVRASALVLALASPAAAIAAEPRVLAPAAGATAGPQQPVLERASTIRSLLSGGSTKSAAAADKQRRPSARERRALATSEGVAARRAERHQRKRSRERRQRARQPIHPVKGEVGYGDAMAAFGHARGRPHEGQDVFAPAGTPVLAVRDAVVLDAGSDGGRGNWVALGDRERELTYVYFHLLEPASVAVGDRVRAGKRVGSVGCTGSCSGDHLHFEIRAGLDPYGEPRDPMPFLQRARPG